MATVDHASPTLTAALPAVDRGGYVAELDAFRGLAILSVMALHWLPRDAAVNAVQNQTTNGVHLFFTLSGFLITRILLTSRAAVDDGRVTVGWSLRQFYARRVLRIFPVYYLVIGLGVALNVDGLRQAWPWHASFLSNVYYLGHGFDGPAAVFWTLAVEEQFYLVWPLAILLLPRRALVPTTAAVAVAATVLRTTFILRSPMFEMLMPACANFLAVGALVGLVDHSRYGSPSLARWTRRAFGVIAVVLVGVAVALFVVRGRQYMATARPVAAVAQAMMSMAYAVTFAACVRGLPAVARLPLRFPPLVYVGRVSYGLYVWHLFVADGLVRAAHSTLLHGRWHAIVAHAAAWVTVKVIVSLAVATASWFAFERPINELKRWFPYVRPARAAH